MTDEDIDRLMSQWVSFEPILDGDRLDSALTLIIRDRRIQMVVEGGDGYERRLQTARRLLAERIQRETS